MKYFIRSAGLLALALTGCVAPQAKYTTADAEVVAREREAQAEIAIRTEATRTTRLMKIAYPLWTKNADLCGSKAEHGIWLNTTSVAQLANNKQFGESVKKFFNVAAQPTVTIVVPGSPAEAAGLKSGDVLSEVDGKPVPEGNLSEWSGFPSNRETPTTLTVLRGSERLTLTVTPIKSCAYGVRYVAHDALNAFADGKAVYVTSGMMRFTESDDELALVLGHELAHNARGHLDAKKTNAMGGLLFDFLAAVAGVNTQGAFSNAAGARYSQEFESEADYVGLYYAARAGYAYAQGPTFWRRMAAENPGAIRGAYGTSHPTTPERFTGLDRAAAEIAEKVSKAAALLPNEKTR